MRKAGQYDFCFEGVESLISRHKSFCPLANYQRGVTTFLPPDSPPKFNEGQKSSINIRSGRCFNVLIHPGDDVPFFPDD